MTLTLKTTLTLTLTLTLKPTLPLTHRQVREVFGYISKYRAQTVMLDYKLKPFIPDFIPAVGDIDAFLKVELFGGFSTFP